MASIEGITHHTAAVNGTELHYVAAGAMGSPILLVHGVPETWWAFHKLIPLLPATHRVFTPRPTSPSSPARTRVRGDGAGPSATTRRWRHRRPCRP